MTMTLFDREGHLTDDAIRAAVAQTLDELARLEVAEHLSFCDNCLVRYTAMLTDDTLLLPQTPLAPPLLQRLRRQAVRVFFNKYTTYAAAAVFALVLWGTGVFSTLTPEHALSTSPAELPAPASSLSSRDAGFLQQLNNTLSEALWNANRSLFDSVFGRAEKDDKAPAAQSTPPETTPKDDSAFVRTR